MMPAASAANPDARAPSLWRTPRAWLREYPLGRGFWIYFLATLFFDAGFCIYFFLFNLYLLDLHFDERFIGLVSGISTLGSVLVMLPAGMLARRYGVRPVLVLCYLASPLVEAARALWVWPAAQIGLALLGGMAMSCGGVCYLPTVARLTTEKNRTMAYTLIFAASLASSAIGGLLCGYIPHWLALAGIVMPAASIKRLLLVASCGIAAMAVVPAMFLRVQSPQREADNAETVARGARLLRPTAAVFRLLLPVTLWAIVLAAFFPFGNVYLANGLHLPLTRIGAIFSIAQIVQIAMLPLTPVVFRRLGPVNGLLAIQAAAGLTLGVLALTRHEGAAIVLFLLFGAMQWMANPGLYDLVMTGTPDAQRDSAAATLLFANAVVSALTTPAAGALYARFGYRAPMIGVSFLALAVATASRALLGRTRPRSLHLRAQEQLELSQS